MDGVKTIKGLPSTPPTDDSAANKAWVQDQTGVTQEALNLTAASDTITPAGASKVINIQPAVSSPLPKYSFYHRMDSATPDEFDSTDGTIQDTVGTPVFSAGSLDLTGGNTDSDPVAISYFRADDGGQNLRTVNLSTLKYFGWRMNFRLNWSGTVPPNCTESTTYENVLFHASAGSNEFRSNAILYIDNAGTIHYKMWADNNTNNQVIGLSSAVFAADRYWVKDKVYEAEFNCLWATSNAECSLYLDGHKLGFAPDTAQAGSWPSYPDPFFGNINGRLWFGGSGVSALPSATDSPGCSNHYIDDFVWYADDTASTVDVREHGNVYNYTPTFLPPGDTAGSETITKLVTTGYETGTIVTLVAASDNPTWSIEPSSSTPPASQEFDIRTRFGPKNRGDRLLVQLTEEGHWAEVGRHFTSPDSGSPGEDSITLASGSTVLTPLGGSEVTLFGSSTSLAADVTYKVDFSDNSFDADYAAGQNVNFDPDPVFNDVTFGYTGELTPVVISGELDMSDGSEKRSAWYWRADGGNWDLETNNAGAVRVLWTPSYTGSPTSNIGIFATTGHDDANCNLAIANSASCNTAIRMVHLNTGEIRAYIHDGDANRYFVDSSGFSAVAGTTYEIEWNWDMDAGNAYLFVDGTLQGSVVISGPWNTDDRGLMHAAFVLGGMDASTPSSLVFFAHQSPGESFHLYDGFAVFNEIQHTANYTATGLPGASAASETINTITTAGKYQPGQIVRFYAGEGSRWTFTDASTPAADNLILGKGTVSNWAPTGVHEWIELKVVDAGGFYYWKEVQRFE
jgi:hypothetical protein